MLNSRLMDDAGGAAELRHSIITPQRPFYSARLFAVVLASVLLACIATFRTFGFDIEETMASYPDVAEGWGLWSWLADQGLSFSVFFFLVNFTLALTISVLVFPSPKEGHPRHGVVQVLILLYMTSWFLFGQARYGTAVGLVVWAMGCESLPIALALCALAVLIHKGMVGGVALLLLWRALRHTEYGLLTAALICGALTYLVTRGASELLEFVGYATYLNWELLPRANTPYKYLYFGLLLAGFLLAAKSDEGKTIAREMLILTLLFFPFSLYLVFAGRSYQVYAVVALTLLARRTVPFVVRYLILAVYFVDVYLLVFRSGCYGPTGCMGP